MAEEGAGFGVEELPFTALPDNVRFKGDAEGLSAWVPSLGGTTNGEFAMVGSRVVFTDWEE